ncbi:MAG: type II secretion system minor pseudopilin GspK [Alphaproteobacteria bacterium]|nr:type II secretion system minor pseudopilin GspK [Alphaproteobacteria bacterium]
MVDETMDNRKTHRARQKGAALVIVLMLIATLSFIVLSLAQHTALAAQRGHNANTRHEFLWLAFGAEAYGVAAIEAAVEAGDGRMTLQSPLLANIFDVPLAEGVSEIRVSDHTGCFNVNSLVRAGPNGATTVNRDAKAEFMALAEALNVSKGKAIEITSAMIDWIDTDQRTELGGAEDGLYTALPLPYRTGGVPIADISEIRAMKGVSKETFGLLQPFICALPPDAPSRINVNLLTTDHAPLLVSLLRGKISTIDALNIIEARPADGFITEQDFLNAVESRTGASTKDIRDRVSLTSDFFTLLAKLNLEGAQFYLSTVVAIDGNGQASILSRRFGESL